MGQDEAIKVVGAITIAVLIIAFAVFVIGRSSKSAKDTSDDIDVQKDAIVGSIGDLSHSRFE